MVRATRVMRLVDALRAAETTTVAALASTLGVSRRTVLRDLATLRAEGVQIAGSVGPGGGLRLEGEPGALVLRFTLAEVVTLWLSARLAREASELPWGNAASSALSKVWAALPAARAQALRALCRRVVVGEPEEGAANRSPGQPPPELLELLEAAFSAGTGLSFRYRGHAGRASTRRVEPHGLLVMTPSWYLLARDLDAQALRRFRMDRIVRPRLLEDVRCSPDPAVLRELLRPLKRWRMLDGRPLA